MNRFLTALRTPQPKRKGWWRPGWFWVGLVAGLAFFYQLFAAMGYIRG